MGHAIVKDLQAPPTLLMKPHEFSRLTWRQAVAPEDWGSLIPLLVAPLQPRLYASQEVSKEVPVDETEEDSRQSALPSELNMPAYASYEFCSDPLPGIPSHKTS